MQDRRYFSCHLTIGTNDYESQVFGLVVFLKLLPSLESFHFTIIDQFIGFSDVCSCVNILYLYYDAHLNLSRPLPVDYVSMSFRVLPEVASSSNGS